MLHLSILHRLIILRDLVATASLSCWLPLHRLQLIVKRTVIFIVKRRAFMKPIASMSAELLLLLFGKHIINWFNLVFCVQITEVLLKVIACLSFEVSRVHLCLRFAGKIVLDNELSVDIKTIQRLRIRIAFIVLNS